MAPEHALAVEDSVPGARSAIAAGIGTVGNLTFVPAADRPARRVDLSAAGATMIIESWDRLAAHQLDGAADRAGALRR